MGYQPELQQGQYDTNIIGVASLHVYLFAFLTQLSTALFTHPVSGRFLLWKILS